MAFDLNEANKEVDEALKCEKCFPECTCQYNCNCGPTCTCTKCKRREADIENECPRCQGSCLCQTPENCNCQAECICPICRGMHGRLPETKDQPGNPTKTEREDVPGRVEWQKHEHPKGVPRDQETMQSIRGSGAQGLVPSNKK